jgi:hypothetical protein
VFCGIYYAAQPAHRSVCHNNTASFHSWLESKDSFLSFK